MLASRKPCSRSMRGKNLQSMAHNLTPFLAFLTSGLGLLVGGFGTAFLYDHRLRLAKASKQAADERANQSEFSRARLQRDNENQEFHHDRMMQTMNQQIVGLKRQLRDNEVRAAETAAWGRPHSGSDTDGCGEHSANAEAKAILADVVDRLLAIMCALCPDAGDCAGRVCGEQEDEDLNGSSTRNARPA